ncbi:MAG TPA: GAF domain-containing SpoIIE family protein phosphatase [Acidimicrobiales bacterium]
MAAPSAKVSKDAAERLRDIEALTDSRLALLGVEDMLVELLDRVVGVLRADTAAVLLLDEDTGELIATAARGIEEEVYQGVRIPLGHGFAGRVAASRQAVVVDDLDTAEVVNPLLRGRGLRSLLGVPLLAGGDLIGVLHVGTLVPRHFTDDDVDLLRMAADRVALATRASMTRGERAAARRLQRSLLPGRLPAVAGIEVAVRYSAGGAGDVGGDWYDMFVHPSGLVCVTVGDVVGRGLRAAVIMGRIRNALRAYALLDDCDPAAALDLVDRQLQHFEPGEMATAVVAVLEPSHERLHVTLAGHPAPVLAPPGGDATYLDLPVDPPLGAVRAARRHVTPVDLPPGALVSFYTDGLVERRGEVITEGLARLCEAVTAGPAEQVCTRVMARLVGAEPPADDVALLVLRRLAAG